MSQNSSPNPNSKFAWQEFVRHGLPKRPAQERVADFLEIHGLMDEATAREQASRCIQCPNPSCVHGCPLCNPIPQWMQLTAEGRFLEAAAVLGSATNMAEICARVCPSDRLCEGTCILDAVSDPVPIQALERFLIEHAFSHGAIEASSPPPNGRKVAILGSGPGGLACAEELARRGYAVTVFDSALVPGGLLVNGTPAFKVDGSVIQRRVDILKRRGVQFRLGAQLWFNPTLQDLLSGFDACFIGLDARRARSLDVPGTDLAGVVQAIPFLLQKNTAVPLDLPRIDVAGQRVLVVGGGDTALDCARAAIRYGAADATCVYRRGETDLPCSRTELQDAREEGVRFIFHACPTAVLGDNARKTRALQVAKTEPGPADAFGRRGFRILPGNEDEIPADFVILALGFDPLPFPMEGQLDRFQRNDWGGLAVDANLMTNLPGVFAAGDLVSGPTLLLHAVRDARRAADRIHAFLTPTKAAP